MEEEREAREQSEEREERETEEQTEAMEQLPTQPAQTPDTSTVRGGPEAATYPYVYAIGRVEPRFPSVAVEKEFAQVTARVDTSGLTDQAVLYEILSERENRYLARRMCWILSIEGLDTYILQPRDPLDFDMLVEAVRAGPRPTDVDVVVGMRGPIAPPEACNGLMVPIVGFEQIYSFDVDSLIEELPLPEDLPDGQEDEFRRQAEDLFYRVVQIADNAGATDEHRALNYLTVRYPRIYAITSEAYRASSSLTGIEVRPSRLSGVRRVVDVIFSYTNRNTDVTEKYFVRVDVTEEFPFLVTKLSPFYERS